MTTVQCDYIQPLASAVFATCSSPRKEKNSKPSTGENVVPHKLISRVNPNGVNKKEYLRRNLRESQITKEIRAGDKWNHFQGARRTIRIKIQSGAKRN